LSGLPRSPRLPNGPDVMTQLCVVPVIAIDGPSASGKGTVAARIAQALGFHCLDSGALYRITAFAALEQGIGLDDETALTALAANLPAHFQSGQILLARRDISEGIRSEACSAGASRVAVLGGVRQALLARQRDYRQSPGLVAEGRDMGSVVFPDAALKVFLTASVDSRAARRWNQLKEKGLAANIADLSRELAERDARDVSRSHAPLQKCADARLLDTTNLTVDESVKVILDWWRQAV